MKVNVEITYRGSFEKKSKEFKQRLHAAMGQVIEEWHKDDLPAHFDTLSSVESRYPGVYRPRKRVYQITKGKKYGTQNLLTYTGGTKRELTRGITISATGKTVRGKMHGANRALNFGGRSNMPDMRAEVLAVNEAEANAMAISVSDKVAYFLDSNEGVETVRPSDFAIGMSGH